MYHSNSTLAAIITLQNANAAINAKDHFKLKVCAIKPMVGGPNKNPKNPIVDTAAIATPGDMVLLLPAIPYISGTIDETPKPTNKNPMVAGIKKGKKMAIAKPVVMSKPLICKVVFLPILFVSQSATKRPVAMVLINAT